MIGGDEVDRRGEGGENGCFISIAILTFPCCGVDGSLWVVGEIDTKINSSAYTI